MADQAGVGSVFDHRRWPGLAPLGDHPPQIHVAPVEGPLGGVLVVGSGVGIPELHRRVHIEDAPVVAPLHDFAAIDIPRQVDQQVSGREVLSQQAPHVLRRHAVLDEGHALLDPGLQSGVVWLKVHDGDPLGIDTEVFDQNGQRTTRHRSKTDEQDSIRKCNHRYGSPAVVLERSRPTAGRTIRRPWQTDPLRFGKQKQLILSSHSGHERPAAENSFGAGRCPMPAGPLV